MPHNKGLVYALASGGLIGVSFSFLGRSDLMSAGTAFALLLCGVSAAALAVIADDEDRRGRS